MSFLYRLIALILGFDSAANWAATKYRAATGKSALDDRSKP